MLNHLQVAVFAPGFDIATLPVHKPDLSGFAVDDCVVRRQAVNSQKCRKARVADNGGFVVSKVKLAACILKATRDADSVIGMLSAGTNPADYFALR